LLLYTLWQEERLEELLFVNTFECRNYYYSFFPSSEKTRPDFRAGGKAPDAID